jgi:carboxylesterase
LPGHGTRWQDANQVTWQDWYSTLSSTVDEVRAACTHTFVMGLSMGGTLALRIAEERPDEVAGLVLVNPSVTTENKAMAVLGVVKWVVPSLKGVGNDIKKPGETELAYARTPLKAAHSLSQLWGVVRADLGKVTAPVLIFRSTGDHVVEPVNAELVLAGIASEDKEERVLHESYHVATLDNDAPAIFAGSIDFVRSHARATFGS